MAADNKLLKSLGLLLYFLILKRLPQTSYPGGKIVKAVRYFCCKGLFKACGIGVVIEPNAFIPFHKVEIGDNSGIGLNARLGAVKIGNDVMMGPDVIILSRNHTFGKRCVPMRLQGEAPDNPVVINDDVWIGARAIILPGVHIGINPYVG